MDPENENNTTATTLEKLDGISNIEFAEQFVKHLTHVHEHSKEEICEVLKSKPADVLEKCRELVFNDLVSKLPQFTERGLYARRKTCYLVDDIYIISFSAVNCLIDKKLEKCFKPQILCELDSSQHAATPSVTLLAEENNDVPTVETLVEMFVKLQDKVKILEQTIKSQNIRIEELEKSKKTGSIQVSVLETGAFSRDQADDETQQASGNNKTEKSPKLGDENSKNMKKSSASVTTNNNNQTVSDGFQHPREQRRNILKGVQGRQCTNKDVTGTSELTHKVQAAPQQLATGTFTIYVGRLHRDTNTQLLRDHLKEIGVSDVSDVISLNNRIGRSESSFCVSVNDETSKDKMFQPEAWPSNVIIRPFRPARQSRPNKQPFHRRGPQRQYLPGTQSRQQSRHRHETTAGRDNWCDRRYHWQDEEEEYGRFNEYSRRY